MSCLAQTNIEKPRLSLQIRWEVVLVAPNVRLLQDLLFYEAWRTVGWELIQTDLWNSVRISMREVQFKVEQEVWVVRVSI